MAESEQDVAGSDIFREKSFVRYLRAMREADESMTKSNIST